MTLKQFENHHFKIFDLVIIPNNKEPVEMHSGGLILDRSQMAGVWSNGGYASFRNDRFKFNNKVVYEDTDGTLKVR